MSAAFVVVFALFLAALLTMAVLAVRWAVRRDRAARARLGSETTSEPAGPAEPAGPER